MTIIKLIVVAGMEWLGEFWPGLENRGRHGRGRKGLFGSAHIGRLGKEWRVVAGSVKARQILAGMTWRGWRAI